MNTHQHHNPNGTWSCPRVRDELDAWALGALERSEMVAIDQHLGWCDTCRQEASHWTSIAGLLPFSLEPIRPSAAAKRALMSRVAADQLPTDNPTPAPRLSAPPSTSPAGVAPPPDSRIHWSQTLIAPLAIALLVMTLWSFELRSQLDSSNEDRQELITSVLPEGLQAFQMTSDCEQCETAGRLLADPQQANALMVAWNLDPGEVHEVWCEEGDGSRALVANLQASETGQVVQPLSFDHPISGYKRIFVTSPDGEMVEIRLSDLFGEPESPQTITTEVQ